MDAVKAPPADYPVMHLAAQLGRLQTALRDTLADQDWQGLRPSHFRVLGEVPEDGISISDLGDRLRMTKQASGQFVNRLVNTGHLRVRVDPRDKRSRLVVRTAKGTRASRYATDTIDRVEQVWAEQLGGRRYAQFREILDELVDTLWSTTLNQVPDQHAGTAQ